MLQIECAKEQETMSKNFESEATNARLHLPSLELSLTSNNLSLLQLSEKSVDLSLPELSEKSGDLSLSQLSEKSANLSLSQLSEESVDLSLSQLSDKSVNIDELSCYSTATKNELSEFSQDTIKGKI